MKEEREGKGQRSRLVGACCLPDAKATAVNCLLWEDSLALPCCISRTWMKVILLSFLARAREGLSRYCPTQVRNCSSFHGCHNYAPRCRSRAWLIAVLGASLAFPVDPLLCAAQRHGHGLPSLGFSVCAGPTCVCSFPSAIIARSPSGLLRAPSSFLHDSALPSRLSATKNELPSENLRRSAVRQKLVAAGQSAGSVA